MTKHGILIIICLLVSCSDKVTTQKDNPDKKAVAQIDTLNETVDTQYNLTINDTFFFRRTLKPYYEIVFIDKNRNNKFYKFLQQKDEIDIGYIYECFKSPFKKHNTEALPDKWIEIIKYKGEFYVYRPSNDSYNLNKFILDDSLMINSFSDPVILPIKSFKKAKEKKYELTVLSIYGEGDCKNKFEQPINIYEIDKKRQVYLFEEPTSNGGYYYFATPVNNVFAFDLIDIFHSEMKAFSDVKLDSVNYQEIIKGL